MAKMLRGNKGSGKSKPGKKSSWYQLNGKVYGEPAVLGSHPVGEMPQEMADRLAGKKE